VRAFRVALPAVFLAVTLGFAQLSTPNEVHFHHVHLNVADPVKSIEFYQRVFGAVPIRFGGITDALFTERSFILLNKVTPPPPADLDTGIWHLGWGGVDMPAEYTSLKTRGVEFQTPLTPLGNNFFMYPYGPDREVLEVCCGGSNHLYNHVHLMGRDPQAVVKWYADNLGIPWRPPQPPTATTGPPPPPRPSAGVGGLRVDNVGFVVFPQQDSVPANPLWGANKLVKTIQPTKGHVVDHIAFSYRHIEPVLDRLKQAGVEIVDPIALRPEFGFRSFFVSGPDSVLIEIVEAKPIPEASWEQH
jgi:catechol 2,3-dioxygenase-like lactoylglutathione lyase family enzyme